MDDMTARTQLTQTILASINTLPLLTACAAELIATINNEGHSLKDVIKVAECDASLTSQIIRLVNSPIYNVTAKITSLDKAISLLGEEAVINLAVNAATSALFDNPLQGYESGPGELWDHDLRTAIASREIARYTRTETAPQTAYTGGLLHDIGKSLVAKHLKGSAAKMLKALDQGKIDDFAKAEEKILGTTHAQVGFEIAQYWHLPDPLPTMIRYHHLPSQAPDDYKTLVFCVHLGDIVAMLSGSGTGADTLAYGIDNEYEEYIKIEKDGLTRVMLEVEKEFSKIKNAIFLGAD
jgi:putative nucleotidyltransferase with HDIG domain